MLKSVQKIVFRLIYNDKHRMGIDVCNITGSVVASVVFILFRHKQGKEALNLLRRKSTNKRCCSHIF